MNSVLKSVGYAVPALREDKIHYFLEPKVLSREGQFTVDSEFLSKTQLMSSGSEICPLGVFKLPVQGVECP